MRAYNGSSASQRLDTTTSPPISAPVILSAGWRSRPTRNQMLKQPRRPPRTRKELPTVTSPSRHEKEQPQASASIQPSARTWDTITLSNQTCGYVHYCALDSECRRCLLPTHKLNQSAHNSLSEVADGFAWYLASSCYYHWKLHRRLCLRRHCLACTSTGQET